MEYAVTLIGGDGIGPEVSEAARRCVDAVAKKHGFGVDWDEQLAGELALKKFGEVLPKNTIDSIKKTKVVLKGPITTPVGGGFRSVNVEIRQRFDLYVNLRPARTVKGLPSRYKNVDLVIVRENTEDLYSGIEFDIGTKETKELIGWIKSKSGKTIREDSAIAIKPISKFGSERIAKFAFDYAVKNKRKKVTAVHKANIMKFADGVFLRAAQKVAKEYPSIEFEDRIVDNMCMQLVAKPELYDVLVCPNLYGDIVSDLCSGLTGGLGLAPGADIGEKCAMFEPVHGSAPKHAGKNEVNPAACILSASMMLKHIGEVEAGSKLEDAVLKVIAAGKDVTYDLNSKKPVSTSKMADAIIKAL